MENLKYNYGSIHTKVDYHTTILLHPDADNTEITNWKEKLSSILQGVPDKTEQIKPLIQFLVAAIAPAKIYMMKQEDESNKDEQTNMELLIVVSGKTSVPFAELEPILTIAYLQNPKVSCSLHNEGVVLEGLRNGHILFSLHCTAENLVYDDEIAVYPVTSLENLTIIKQKAVENFNRQFRKAQDFYNSAVYLYQNHQSPLAVFMLHQATELTYRGILQSLNSIDKKTHEIRSLMKYSRRYARQLNSAFADTTPEDKRIIQLLENAYLDGRYTVQYSVEEKDLLLILEKVKLLQSTAQKIVEANCL